MPLTLNRTLDDEIFVAVRVYHANSIEDLPYSVILLLHLDGL